MFKLRLYMEDRTYLCDWRWTGPVLPALVIWNNGHDAPRYFVSIDATARYEADEYASKHSDEFTSHDYYEVNVYAEAGRIDLLGR